MRQPTLSLKEFCQLIAGECAQLEHAGDQLLHGLGSLAQGQAGQVGFWADANYRKDLNNSALSAVVVQEYVADVSLIQIKVADVYAAWRQAAAYFYPPEEVRMLDWREAQAHFGEGVRIGVGSVVAENAHLAQGVVIGCQCSIGAGVRIGEHSRLDHQVVLMDGVRLGQRCHILSGAIIGERGFGFSHQHGHWSPIPQIASVQIGDDVEIGALTTIDCGTFDNTCIGNGVKLDNHIQVGHNVHIGDHTIMAGCSVIAGSTHIGAHCVIGGATVFNGHIHIADGVQITGHSSISKDIKQQGAVYSSSFPAMPVKEWLHFCAKLRTLARQH